MVGGQRDAILAGGHDGGAVVPEDLRPLRGGLRVRVRGVAWRRCSVSVSVSWWGAAASIYGTNVVLIVAAQQRVVPYMHGQTTNRPSERAIWQTPAI